MTDQNARQARHTLGREAAKESEGCTSQGRLFAPTSLLRVRAVAWLLLAGFAFVLPAGCTGVCCSRF